MTIYQGDETLCGWAATRMFLAELTGCPHYGRLALEGKGPYTLERLEKAALRAGVRLTFREAFRKEDLYRAKGFPLLLLEGSGKGGHLLLARRRVGRFILLEDPSSGKKWFSISRFITNWTGLFGEGEIVDKEAERPGKKSSLLPFWPRLMVGLLSFLSTLSIFLGLFFLEGGTVFLAPLFLVLGGLLLIAGQRVSIHLLKRMDTLYDPKLADVRDVEFQEAYERYQSLKRGAVGGLMSGFSSFFAGLALLALLGLSDVSFLLSGSLLSLYLLLEGAIGRRKATRRASELSIMEKVLCRRGLSFQKRLAGMREIEDGAYGLADLLSYGRIVYLAMILLLSLIPSLISGNTEIAFYLYSVFGHLALGTSFQGTLEYLSGAPGRRSDLDYFDQYIDPVGLP